MFSGQLTSLGFTGKVVILFCQLKVTTHSHHEGCAMTARALAAFFLFFIISSTTLADTTTITILKSGKLEGDLRGLSFPTPMIGYAVGDNISVSNNNFIAKSTDGGVTWQRLQTPALTSRPWAVTFLNADTGFVGGYTGMLLRTTDGGTSWTNVNNTTYAGNFNDIRFVNRLRGYACGTNSGGTVITTTDGGTTWSPVPLGNTNTRYSVLFLSEMEILISGSSGNIARSTDGGATWGTTTIPTATLYSLARVGTDGVVVVGSARTLFKSTNRGVSFNGVLSQAGAGTTLYAVSMADSMNGFATGSNGQNFRTRDGWATVDSVLPGAYTAQVTRTVVCKGATEIIAGGDQGNIFRSTDFGNTWSTVESSTRYYALDFLDRNLGVAVGWRGTVVRTTNGGATWTELRSLNGFELYDVQVLNANTWFICGGAGRFYHTSNGGATFTERLLPVIAGGNAKALHFFDQNRGYCTGEMGRIYYTTNAGTTWQDQYDNGTSFNNLEDLFFLNDTLGFAVGERGRVVRTVNGTTWDTTGIARPAVATLWETHWTSPTTGFASGQNGAIYKTTNGGANWSVQNDVTGLTNVDVIDIEVVNPASRGYAVGEQGKIFRLVNENLWVTDRTLATPAGTAENLWGLDFADSTRAFISGYYGTIYRLDITGTTGTKPDAVPDAFRLEQNYPNPFNPVTSIRFSIPAPGRVSLKVYDILGRDITTLVNGHLSSGEHTVTFNSVNLPSGVYFYTLSSGDFTATRRMVTLK